MTMKPLVLGLGNDLLGDDGIGIAAARRLARSIGDIADVVESSLHGLALMDLLIGYRQVLIIDAIRTGRHLVGTVMEFSQDDLRPVTSPSPHYSGLPEMMALARQLGVDFPRKIRIIAVEIGGISDVGDGMSQAVRGSLNEIERRVMAVLGAWNCCDNLRTDDDADQTLPAMRKAKMKGARHA
jgi:hydrogenase maturation protease